MIDSTRIRRDQRERLLRRLAFVTFVIFFQGYMVAPIIPRLSENFKTSAEIAGTIVPAYLMPYAVATLVYGYLADRIGIRRVLFASLAAFCVLTIGTASAPSFDVLVLWRAVTALGAGGVVPLALVLVGGLFPYEQRGRPLGWLFGAMAGGMAFGSTFGAILEPLIGWRGLFVLVGVAAGALFFLLLPLRDAIAAKKGLAVTSIGNLVTRYRDLVTTPRGRRTYGYVLANAIFHSGVFTWTGVYFQQRYGLGPVGIGLALLGYGVPGFLFGPMIGRAADRFGRARLVPIGLASSAVAAVALMGHVPIWVAAIAVTVLSLGYDMTQPLFGGIVTSLGGDRPGQAMGLNVFALFLGFGIGSLIFGALLHRFDFAVTLAIFGAIETLAAIASIALFQSEVPQHVASASP